MAKELIIVNNGTFANPELNKITAELASASLAIGAANEKLKIQAATALATIEAGKLYEPDFASALDYAIKVLTLPKSTAYMYIQVGRALLNNEIPTEDANGKSFNLSQLRSLCAIKKPEERTEAVNNGDISADMTTDEMDAEIQSKNPKKEKKPRAERVFMWEEVGEEGAEATSSKTDLIKAIAENGGEYIGEISSKDDCYIVAISCSGRPLMFHRLNEVKKPVAESK